jgi:hypothetical protein
MRPHDADVPTETDLQVIGEFALNARDVLRIALYTYDGRPCVSARKFFRNEGGELRPTRKGLDLAIERLPLLLAGLTAARERAQNCGLLPTYTDVEADNAA